VKIGYRKIQINGDWFRWDKRQEKLKKNCYKKERIRRRLGEKMYKEKVNKKVEGQRHRKVREKRENKRIEVQ
jgi:UDP-2,3-diacylglucosamine pyrophosphatase LpxH